MGAGAGKGRSINSERDKTTQDDTRQEQDKTKHLPTTRTSKCPKRGIRWGGERVSSDKTRKTPRW
jgi:hypothetical protein